MNIICEPAGIIDIERPGQGVMDIAGAGFQNIVLDMSMFCPPGELENFGKENRKRPKNRVLISEHPEELQHSVNKVLELCGDKKLNCRIAAAPYLNWDSRLGREKNLVIQQEDMKVQGGLRERKCVEDHQDGMNSLLQKLAKESIRICGQAGCRYIIIRPLFAGISEAQLWEENRKYYLELAEEAARNDVMILLENQCKDINGHLVRGICSDGRDAAGWVDALNKEAGEERFGFCVNAGTCNLCGQNMYDFILSLRERIKAVILQDCDGVHENALLPFTSVGRGQPQTDWLNLIRGLRETGFDGALVMDFRDTAGAFSPILRPELIRLAKSTADYFKWQIGIENLLRKYPARVLFGAGNMCRNYMKCYGEKYPPLFTCDNNKALWGSMFCGLEVKNPESIKDIPEDCAVFICNIYYREIEEQLRKMGVTNPIEFFNDEYMPSFYFDRLE